MSSEFSRKRSHMTLKSILQSEPHTRPPKPSLRLLGTERWRAAREFLSLKLACRVQDIGIDSSHLGMGWNPAVLRVMADRLAHHPNAWKPYRGFST